MCNCEEILIGRHVKKFPTFLETVINAHEQGMNCIQIFTGNTKRYYKKEPSKEDIKATREYIITNNINMYIHSIYLINLGRTQDIDKALESLRWELIMGPQLGAKGVVVHVGKYLKGTEEDAICAMKDNIIGLEEIIDESCPLLIETPAGQGTEILTLLEDFAKFIKDLKGDKNIKKIGCCVDTCHIFASGYIPMYYIEELEKLGICINLVHYNDSKTEQGSRKDRHEYPGKGYIGTDEMKKVLNWCKLKNIPMIMEI